LPAPSVSIAQNLISFIPCGNKVRDRLAVYLRNRLFNFGLIERLVRSNSIDFLGINYYTRHLVETRRWTITSLLTDVCKGNHDNLKKNSLGWEIYPEGLYNLLMYLKRYKLPIFILENGISILYGLFIPFRNFCIICLRKINFTITIEFNQRMRIIHN